MELKQMEIRSDWINKNIFNKEMNKIFNENQELIDDIKKSLGIENATIEEMEIEKKKLDNEIYSRLKWKIIRKEVILMVICLYPILDFLFSLIIIPGPISFIKIISFILSLITFSLTYHVIKIKLRILKNN